MAEAPSTDSRQNEPPSILDRLFRHVITTPSALLRIIVGVVLASFLGGFLWNLFSHLLGWRFHMGGSGYEPRGIPAFIWGVITVLPVVCCAFFASYTTVRWRSILPLTLLSTLAGGLGAMLFYSSGFRSWVESWALGYGSQEIFIGVAWALFISIPTYLPLWWLEGHTRDQGEFAWYLLFHAAVSAACPFLVIAALLMIDRPVIEVQLLRGTGASIALSFGMFWGLFVTISARAYQPNTGTGPISARAYQPDTGAGAVPADIPVATIRRLLRDAFTAEKLKRFCQDRSVFRPILSHFGPNFSFEAMIDAVLEYCSTQALFPELLSEIRSDNPRQFERYESQLGSLLTKEQSSSPVGEEDGPTP